MKNRQDPKLIQIKQLLNRGLHNLALEVAEDVEQNDSVLGRELLSHVFAAMRDHLSFLKVTEGIIPKELPQDLRSFLVASHMFVGNTQSLRELVDDLLRNRKTLGDTYSAASTLVEIGEYEGALELLGQVPVENRKNTSFQYLEARILLSKKEYQASIDKFEDVKSSLKSNQVTAKTSQLLKLIAFSLARAYDKLNAFEQAWHAAQEGYELDDEKFEIGAFEDLCDNTMRFFTKKRLQSLNRASEFPVEPLLVMGNPRSGTTLLDTILGMHDQVASGGELSIGSKIQNEIPKLLDSYSGYPDCLVDLRIPDANQLARHYAEVTSGISSGRKYITNKALNINLQLGLFYCITPRMKVISLHRHPLDNCISCYLNLVGVPGHSYNKRQDDQAKVWILRRRLQDHWAEVAEELPMLQLRYESMVHNQEDETKRILKFFDLGFQNDCLNFHEASNIAATVSKDQVREPMYKTSAGRWKNYEPFIPILVEKLNPWCTD